jgi:cation:H+ antiporter
MVEGGPLVQLGVVLASTVGLWVGGRLLVDSAVRLARGFGLSELAIGLTVVAMGTSAPEVIVSVDAALKGSGDIAAANVLGSNVYNLAFILGVVSLLRVIPVAEALVRRDGVALLVSLALGGVTLLDGRVTRVEGAALAGGFAAYTAYLLWTSRTGAGASDAVTATAGGVTEPVTERVTFRGRTGVMLLAGLALVLVSGDYMVVAASNLARSAGVSEWVIGGTVVAAGTSTPEFAVSLVAVRRGSLGVSVGNVVGSNVFNITGVLGLAAVVRPLAVGGAALETLAWLAAVSAFIVAALWSGRVLSRLEGALFTASELCRWALGLLGILG